MILEDDEFGSITVKKHHLARHIKLQVRADGTVMLTTPSFTSSRRASMIINDSREAIRQLKKRQASHKHTISWVDGSQIGSSHVLQLIEDDQARIGSPQARTINQKLIIRHHTHEDQNVLKSFIDDHAKAILRKQAKAYLTRQLAYLAERMDCRYEKVRFSNASTRWGSCSSEGTISLNIWLMTLPKEMIDYVLIHELSHTKNMNHSPKFWEHVERFEPNYKNIRRELKKHSPMP